MGNAILMGMADLNNRALSSSTFAEYVYPIDNTVQTLNALTADTE